MSLNQFTNLDFNNLKTQLKDYLRSNSNFTDFDFEGSNFSVLVDILAYNSYINSFNANMAVNESFLDSATLRENVVSLVRNIGYVPRSKRSAVAKVSFTVDVSTFEYRPKTITLKSGVVALGSVQNGNYIFSIPDDIVQKVDNDGIAYFTDISIYEGSLLTKTFVVDNTNPRQTFILPNPSIDTTTIRVSVTGTSKEKYELYQNIFKVDSNSKLFLIQEIEDEKYQILFGDNIIGKKPINGSSILTSYIVTNGASANGAYRFTFSGILKDNTDTTVTSGISILQTLSSAANGDDIESTESVKYLAPRVYSSQYRAVTANDYKGLIPFLFSNVESVVAYGGEELNPPEYGKVYIAIKPRQGYFISEITKTDIKRKLKDYSIAGIKPEIVDLKYLYVELDITAYYNSNLTSSSANVITKVRNTIDAYSNSTDVNSFAGRFKYSKVCGLIDNSDISITSNITKVKMRRNLIPTLNKVAIYELCFGNEFHVSKKNSIDGNGYNIKSSGFTIDGNLNTLYMSDVPINSTTGTVFFFKLEGGIPVTVIANAGTVYYPNGEIILNAITFTSSVRENGIEVQAIPESNDVIGTKDTYLEIDNSNINITTIEDIISSGENLAATRYITTSSYTNENYIR